MKILITGAKGQLGYDLKRTFKNHHLILTDIDNLDITSKKRVADFFVNKKPEFVIHAAAFTDVDGAENKKRICFKINQLGTRNVARAAEKIGATIVYISTDYVFSGNKKTPYKETDRAYPLNIYGESKLAGEKEIKKICNQYYIIRTAWLYGKGGENFVHTMLRLGKRMSKLEVVNDQRGTPTYSNDLSRGIKRLIAKKPNFGIYHLTNSGATTWYSFAKKIFTLKKIKIKLSPTESKKFVRPAKRPKYSVLSKDKVRKLGIKMRPWEKALSSFLNKLTLPKR